MDEEYLTQPLIPADPAVPPSWISRGELESGGDGDDGQWRHPGMKVLTFTVMVWFVSECITLLL